MLKNNHLIKCTVISLIFHACSIPVVSAHEGHDHSHEEIITIGKKTFVHLQTILSTYQEVYVHLVKKDMHGIPDLAHKLLDVARQAAQTEPDGAGRHMMEHVRAGVEGLKKARNIQEAQGALLAISNSLIPFFKAWPNQLKRNELKLCYCRKDEHSWLQPLNCSVACPYNSDTSSNCTDIEEIK
ncbi:MAG: hypothetical protein HYV59_14375 [Planctomycetes bacterium]|nr:hypothetical protein [Planctomycetota bacterium]